MRKTGFWRTSAIAAAFALTLVLTACGEVGLDVDSVGIDVQRPGAPGSVTATASPCGNFALVSWRAGSNTREDQFEIVGRPSGSQTAFLLDDDGAVLDLEIFVTMWDRPITGSGIAIEHNRMTFSWNPDSTLGWVEHNNIDQFYRVVRLALDNREPIPNLQIGVRAREVFHENWYHHAHSAVVWAGGTFASTRFFTPRFDPSLPAAADMVITGTSGQLIDLNDAFNIEEDLLPLDAGLRLRWDIRTGATAGSGVLLESSNGEFTPRFGGMYNAVATIIGTTITRSVLISVTGTQFIPSTGINAPVRPAGSNILNAPTTIVTPAGTATVAGATAPSTAIQWEVRQRPVPTPAIDIPMDQPNPLTRQWSSWSNTTLPLTIPTGQEVQIRATLPYGLFWTEERRDPSFPIVPGEANSAHRRTTFATIHAHTPPTP